MVEGLQIAIAIGALGYSAVVAIVTLAIRRQVVFNKNKGKTWLVELNSNNQTGRVQLVQAPREGYQVPNGPFVKFEGDFTYIDRENVRPLVVYNGDTGFPIRAKTGEAEEMDGMIYAAAAASKDLERVQRSHGGIDWVKIAFIGAFALVGIVTGLGFLMWQIMKAQGG